MDRDDDTFEPRLGRSPRERAPRTPKSRFRAQLLGRVHRAGGDPRAPARLVPATASPPSGRFNARGRGARIAAALPRASGWAFDRARGVRVRARRVTVKARVVKLGGNAAKVAAHLRYIERDGVARDGEPGRLYSTFSDDADAKAFVERAAGDRHQFRLIVSPEDGGDLGDLRPFTRDLMARVEQDLETTLDWVAADHHDTGHPHSHIVIRGVTEDGKVLNIAGDYIAHGFRHRASELMTRALGVQSELEVQRQLEAEVDAERLTRLDRSILARAVGQEVDLRLLDRRGDLRHQQLLIARMRRLEAMGLAASQGPLRWSLVPEARTLLDEMERRGDIIRTIDRAVAKLGRRPELFAIHQPGEEAAPIIGQVVAAGTSDEQHERRYLIVDGVDGRTHYVDIGASDEPARAGAIVRLEPKLAAIREADRTVAAVAAATGGRYSVDLHLEQDAQATQRFAEAHVRRLEAMRRLMRAPKREPNGSWIIAPDHLDKALAYEQRLAARAPVRIETLSPAPLERLTGANALTWLDRELASRERTALAPRGFGADLARALQLRQQWLVEEQLASVEGDRLMLKSDALARLRRRELRQAGARLSRELGLAYAEAQPGSVIDGVCRRRVELTSGRFALIERSKEFTLVPWRPVLERAIGRRVSGIDRGGAISWRFGRERGGPSL